MDKLKIKIIIGSTRQNRFSEKPAHWLYDEIKKETGVEVELLDLRDYPMPFFDEPITPSMSDGNYSNKTVGEFAAKIKDGDAFIIVTPEYNHGYPAVLKNALDSIYREWHKKPVGFVSYGGVGGARSVEQLRQVVIELQMINIRNSINLPSEIYMAAINEPTPVKPEIFQPLRTGKVDRVRVFLDELITTAKATRSLHQ